MQQQQPDTTTIDSLDRTVSTDRSIEISKEKLFFVETEEAIFLEEKVFEAEIYLQHLGEMFNGKKQYMMEMVEILLQQIPETSRKMEAAIELENWEEVFFQSHRIKSTFRIAGLNKLVNVCLAIEGRTRIIAPEELHLVPDFFLQFKALGKEEIPNLEAALKYLKECQEVESRAAEQLVEVPKTDDSDSMLLP